jgi:hypothetical protein
MSELIYYNRYPLQHCDIPGIKRFLNLSQFFHPNIGIIDRTDTIKIPLAATTKHPIPVFKQDFNLSFKECALHRMKDLDHLHQTTGKQFRLMYSGGIDSTGVLSAFVAYYGLERAAELAEISCNKDSMEENPWAWDRIIRKGKFRLHKSTDHADGWRDDRIIITGECSDQLFGLGGYTASRTGKDLYPPATSEEIRDHLSRSHPKADVVDVCEILQKISSAAPFDIENLYLFVWWINFVLTWDGVVYRTMAQANIEQLPEDTLASGYVAFYNTDLFQQWSMKYHYDNPRLYAESYNFKRICKEFIIDTLGIPEYQNKFKTESFAPLNMMRRNASIINSDLRLLHGTDCYTDYLQKDNDFLFDKSV